MLAHSLSRRWAIGLIAALLPAVATPADANARLRDTRWVLHTLDGVVVDGQAMHMVLHAGTQHLTGFAGCNHLRGRFTQRGTQIALSALASTRRACPVALMKQEARFIELLGSANAYRIEGGSLSLLQDDTARLSFRAGGTN